MFFRDFDDHVHVLCNRLTYRHSLKGYREYVEGWQFGWLLAKLEHIKGKEFSNWCSEHDGTLTTKDKIEWLQVHLSEKQRAKFDVMVQQLREGEQKHKEELEQELAPLNYRDPRVPRQQRYINLCVVVLIMVALIMFFTI